MPRVKHTRVLSGDVGRYGKVDTGTAGKPQPKSSVLSTTRVDSAGVNSSVDTGDKTSSRMKSTRVKSA